MVSNKENNNFILLSIFILLFSALLTCNIYASTGKIRGRVYDSDTGEALPGANVMVESVWVHGKIIELEEKLGTASDEEGYFFILNVRPGIYNVKAMMIGYKPLVIEKVQVNMDRTVTIDFPLETTVLEMQAVRVVAEKEIIRPDIAGTQEIITVDRITETPELRIDEFVSNIKGVELVAGADGHGLSVRGGSIRETDVRIDGISARDPRSENSYLSINSTAVEELQVLTGGFEAKYGGFRSGLVNVVTREGRRDKYTFSIKMDITPTNQRKFFGSSPWSEDSWIYRIFADTTENGYAYTGTLGDTTVPEELRTFRGWEDEREGRRNYEAIGLPAGAKLTPEQKRQIWLMQHPQYEFANKPDAFVEATITGPLPGSKIPLFGDFFEKSAFMLSGKYENSQFAFPIGPRDDYLDWNVQTKITTHLSPRSKFSINSLYAKVKTNTSNRPSSFGGALVDYSSRFGFLSSTEQSVRQQAGILGSGNGFVNMYNKSALQYLDQRWFLGGLEYSYAISPKSFFNLDFLVTYTDNEIKPFAADTTSSDGWTTITVDDDTLHVLKYPTIGSPNASTNTMRDITDLFLIYGGLQQEDSSYTMTANLRGDLTAQMGRNHEIETGFEIKYTYSHVNSGTWMQTEKMWTPAPPGTWQYFTVNPLEIGAYFQDKLEFEGMIAKIGVRLDYFNPNKDSYMVEHPLDEDYSNFYNLIYEYLPGKWGSWERWVVFREMLDDPPGWPKKDTKPQIKISPRLGVSFPITVNSKLYFNYGHFYQRPQMNFLYDLTIGVSNAHVPSADLDLGKTVAYEFGYEQRFLKSFLFNLSFYYKDVTNDPLSRTYIDYWEEFVVSKYYPDAFSDVRGIELRFEKNIGRFLTLWANYEYMLQSGGQTGLQQIFENRVKARNELRSPNITTIEPRPRGHLNINLHTPENWGFSLFGLKPLSSIYFNFLMDWRDGGKIDIEYDPLTGERKRAEVVDYFNIDLRASKLFAVGGVNAEIVLTVTNLLNIKRLYTGGMSVAQYNRYKESLHFPFEEGDQKGNDKWGEWDKEHIDIGWFTAPLFLNPRRILLGLRFNL